MLKLFPKLFFTCALLATGLLASQANAQQEYTDRASATAFLEASGAYATYKSEMVESNDTGTGFAYTVGFHAGQERNVGILFRTDSQNITFKLTDSAVQTTWQDAIIRYRMGPVYLGLIMGTAAMKAKIDGEEALDVTGSGYGGNAGFTYSIRRIGGGYVDLSYVSISQVRELEQREVAIGARMDIDAGVSFRVTRSLLDFIAGFKYRTYSVDLDTSYAEIVSAVYLGFRMSSTF